MPPDDLDRDKLYSADAVDGGFRRRRLELEPLDPEVLAAEQRRAAEAIDVHRTAIDVNEVYRDFDANRDSEIVAASGSPACAIFAFSFKSSTCSSPRPSSRSC